jgi:hypothetical protein
MEETAATKRMVEKARRVFGPVAGTLAVEVLKESADEKAFGEMYSEKLAKITGNRALVENILKNNGK